MNPLKRETPMTRSTDHEDRIQTLERRIPDDYPKWASWITDLEGGTIEASGIYLTEPTFPDDEPCVLPDCDPDEARTVGNYYLLPLGFQGPFHIYFTIVCSGGCHQIEQFYETVDLGAQGETANITPFVHVEIWRDDEPCGRRSAADHRRALRPLVSQAMELRQSVDGIQDRLRGLTAAEAGASRT